MSKSTTKWLIESSTDFILFIPQADLLAKQRVLYADGEVRGPVQGDVEGGRPQRRLPVHLSEHHSAQAAHQDYNPRVTTVAL